jgi:TonB family protein
MSCTDVASVLDSHRMARLGPAERAQIDAHLAACADCMAAWHAQTELLALPVPPVPATLLERALLASRLPHSAPARRARTPVIVASVLLASAAAAAVTFVSLRDEPAPVASPTETSPPAAAATASTLALDEPLIAAAPSAAQGDGVTSVELVETGLDFLPMVRANPDYPPRALSERLAGYVQLEFDVTAAGRVENVRAVRSSDPQFEEPAIRAIAQWRYLPRIIAGERASSSGVQTIIRFQMDDPTTPSPSPLSGEALEAAQREWAAYSADLMTAMDRLAADDLRGVELQLDEMQALYGTERADLWGFYGYVYTLQRNFDRAIDAYERSVAIHLRSSNPTSGPWVPLANLYFARHQYDVALKTLLRPRQAHGVTTPIAGSRLAASGAEALIERLRALGVTEETL